MFKKETNAILLECGLEHCREQTLRKVTEGNK